MTLAGRALLTLVVVAALHQPAHAQETAADRAFQTFVQNVADVWAASDVTGLVALLPEDGPVLLDAGGGSETVNQRHAAAALRALFAQLEVVDAAVVRATLASTAPTSGFGELTWRYRLRGAPATQVRSVYLATRLVSDRWQITELRLMP